MAKQSSASWDVFLHSRLFLVGAAGVVLFFAVGFARQVVHRYELNQQIHELQGQIHELDQHKSQLSDLIQYFSSPLFAEQEAREKLGKAKPGEAVVIIPTTGTTVAAQQPTTTPTTETATSQPNPVKWWQFFFSSSTS